VISNQFVRTFVLICAALGAAQFASSCSYKLDIPTEFPTPPPQPVATPLAKLAYKRDAELEKSIAKIAEAAKGTVGVAALNLKTGEAAFLNPDARLPMLSVYKLPIAMAVMDQVRVGKLELDEVIGVTKEDMVRVGFSSALRDENPNGGEFTIRELARLSMEESDGTASDVLMRIAGGPLEVQSFLSQIGVRDMAVLNSEKEIGKDWETQYRNNATPVAAAELLRWLDSANNAAPGDGNGMPASPPANVANTSNADVSSSTRSLSEFQTLVEFLAQSKPGSRRLKGELPPETFIAHKTGTSGTQKKVAAATNDIGIVRLPDGSRFVIAVFVSDSTVDLRTREGVIAKIAKAVWDRFAGSN
jgi:beta-lactamase class A